jgi:hypothetical protein
MNPEWLSFLIGMGAGVGLVIAVVSTWRLWKEGPSRVQPEFAAEAERWLEGQHGGGSGNPD